MYLLLDEAGQEKIRRERLLALEQEHCSTLLRLAEMDGIGVPSSARGRQALLGDLSSIEAAINWHRSQIGFDEPIGSPRVEPGATAGTDDDGADQTQPVGEEAPGDGTDGTKP